MNSEPQMKIFTADCFIDLGYFKSAPNGFAKSWNSMMMRIGESSENSTAKEN